MRHLVLVTVLWVIGNLAPGCRDPDTGGDADVDVDVDVDGDADADADGDGGTLLPMGEPCEDGAQCVGGECRFTDFSGAHRCTEPCDLSAGACPGDMQCLDIEGAPVCATVALTLIVHLQTGLVVSIVDRLEVVVAAAPGVDLGNLSGSAFDGGVRWESRSGPRSDELAAFVTGDFFRANAVEVAMNTWEIDVPFLSGLPAGEFAPGAAVFWTDDADTEQEVGFGSGAAFALPLPDPTTPIVVEVTCRDAWQYTCRTGCGPGVNPCDSAEDCGPGTWVCEDRCCSGGG